MLASHGISRLSSFEDWSKGWLDYASARKQLFVEGLRAGKLHQPSTHSDQKVAMLECFSADSEVAGLRTNAGRALWFFHVPRGSDEYAVLGPT
jgi:hypothetical protein